MSPYPEQPAFAPGWLAVSRGAALGLGMFMLLNAAERRLFEIQSAQTWLCSFAPLDPRIVLVLLALGGTAFGLFAARPDIPEPIRWITIACSALIAGGVIRELSRILTGPAAGNARDAVFQPAAVLTVLVIILIGLLSSSRRLRAVRLPVVSLPMTALLTVFGILVATVRGQVAPDAVTPDASTLVALVCDRAPEPNDTNRLAEQFLHAERVLKGDAESRLVVFGVGHVISDTARGVIRDSAKQSGIAETRVIFASEMSTFSQVFDEVVRTGHATDEAEATDTEPKPADPPLILWLGNPLRFAEVRLIASRRGIAVQCHSGEERAALRLSSGGIAVATASYGRELLLPLVVR